jgi:hypothetical protein
MAYRVYDCLITREDLDHDERDVEEGKSGDVVNYEGTIDNKKNDNGGAGDEETENAAPLCGVSGALFDGKNPELTWLPEKSLTWLDKKLSDTNVHLKATALCKVLYPSRYTSRYRVWRRLMQSIEEYEVSRFFVIMILFFYFLRITWITRLPYFVCFGLHIIVFLRVLS